MVYSFLRDRLTQGRDPIAIIALASSTNRSVGSATNSPPVSVLMLLANSEVTGILPHTILFESPEIRIPPPSKP